jgi:pyruvate-ferredoxin/flavodoxin oxidoreductase
MSKPALVAAGKAPALKLEPQLPLRKPEAENFKFFMDLPQIEHKDIKALDSVKGSQLCRPLFEFSGACAGCGETPYIKLVTQLFGDHILIANATGCSSIYGGNLPTTPYCQRKDGRGPAWSNSLFEDNAEFGLGMCMTLEKHTATALQALNAIVANEKAPQEMKDLLVSIRDAEQKTQEQIEAQRERVAELKKKLSMCECSKTCPDAKQLLSLCEYLVKKTVWIFGGDGWAYDIGYGGLDHVLASGHNVKVLVLDTEVYSNTGGQASKSTPLGAIAKFAAAGKPAGKKDLGLMEMTYGNVYVAQVSMGANPGQVVKAIAEAEAYDGPALIIAYAHCINHGINMVKGLEQQKIAVETGHFPLYRYNPATGEFKVDSKEPSRAFAEQASTENRFKQLAKLDPEKSKAMVEEADRRFKAKYELYTKLAGIAKKD